MSFFDELKYKSLIKAKFGKEKGNAIYNQYKYCENSENLAKSVKIGDFESYNVNICLNLLNKGYSVIEVINQANELGVKEYVSKIFNDFEQGTPSSVVLSFENHNENVDHKEINLFPFVYMEKNGELKASSINSDDTVGLEGIENHAFGRISEAVYGFSSCLVVEKETTSTK